MQIQENFPLREFNSFGINANARYYGQFGDRDQLEELLLLIKKTAVSKQKLLILGGGSNILLTGNLDGWVLKAKFEAHFTLHRRGRTGCSQRTVVCRRVST